MKRRAQHDQFGRAEHGQGDTTAQVQIARLRRGWEEYVPGGEQVERHVLAKGDLAADQAVVHDQPDDVGGVASCCRQPKFAAANSYQRGAGGLAGHLPVLPRDAAAEVRFDVQEGNRVRRAVDPAQWIGARCREVVAGRASFSSESRRPAVGDW
ncbi:MAG: hypothetical protein ACRDPA_14535 [Solirubrobacteraceae bacterium]